MAEKITEKEYKYKFSFVIPIYNVEEYLMETVESILAQSMDFESNCEIVFVNDGSPDNSEEICLRYKGQFPNNIKYIKQKNGGLSAARNTGIKHAEGKYLSFIDPDDKFSSNTADEVFNFFEEHYSEIDLVAIKVKMFEAKTGDHILNYRFDTSRVIDVEKEFDTIQIHAASAFVKHEAFLRGHLFDPKIRKFAEDLKFTTEVIMDKMAYGVVAEPVYWYRKRDSGGSIMDSERTSKVWYMDIPTLVHLSLFQYSRKKFGYIPKYVQYIVMHDIQWRFRQEDQTILKAEEVKRYKETLDVILNMIDDDVIMAQRHMGLLYKYFVLSKKHNANILRKAYEKDQAYFFGDTKVFDYKDLSKKCAACLDLIQIQKNRIKLEGYFTCPMFNGMILKLRAGGQEFPVIMVDRPSRHRSFLGEDIQGDTCFTAEAPIKAGSDVAIILVTQKGEKVELPLVVNRNALLNQSVGRSYRVIDDYIVIKRPNSLEIDENTAVKRMAREFKYQAALIQSMQLRSLLVRIAYFIIKPFVRRKIWLLSDRVNAAGDNAEALFRYTSKRRHEFKVYFAISRKSPDYARMKQYGEVVNYGSFRYKLLFLYADKVISSHADAFVTNAFGTQAHNLIDLYGFDFVFLQHGVIHNDLSQWLNRYNKNIKLFVTSARDEYKALLGDDYGYTSQTVKLTGLPRFDLLKSSPSNKLVIMPTWRNNLTGTVDSATGVRLYNEDFKTSDYFKFYQQIINDERVIAALNAKKMTGEFYLHPSLSSQITDFRGNDTIKVMNMPYNYRKAFSEANILVTDYSSVAFDFAYLKKPVIYTQFDKNSFYKLHAWKSGYFSYDKDGFGPVVTTFDDAVNAIIDRIDKGCVMEDVYRKKVEHFFYKFDKNNSKRVYDAIRAMNNK